MHMSTDRERFDEITAMLRDDDLAFAKRTDRLAREVGGASQRRKLVVAALSIVVGLALMVACVAWRQPLLGALVYLIVVVISAPAFELLGQRHGERLLRRITDR